MAYLISSQSGLKLNKLLFITGSFLVSLTLFADDRTGPTSTRTNKASTGEHVAVDFADQDYWNMTDSKSLRVVQNRTFSKTHRLELGLLGGITSSDPFLAIYHTGAKLGFYITEGFQIHVLGLTYLTSPNAAAKALSDLRTGANTNPPSLFYGGGIEYSPIYGKISLFGKSIIHFDLYLTAGAGMTKTNSGSYMTGYGGIGQLFFITKSIGIRTEYKMTLYNENIIEQIDPSTLGQNKGSRLNRGDVITFGLSFLL